MAGRRPTDSGVTMMLKHPQQTMQALRPNHNNICTHNNSDRFAAMPTAANYSEQIELITKMYGNGEILKSLMPTGVMRAFVPTAPKELGNTRKEIACFRLQGSARQHHSTLGTTGGCIPASSRTSRVSYRPAGADHDVSLRASPTRPVVYGDASWRNVPNKWQNQPLKTVGHGSTASEDKAGRNSDQPAGLQPFSPSSTPTVQNNMQGSARPLGNNHGYSHAMGGRLPTQKIADIRPTS